MEKGITPHYFNLINGKTFDTSYYPISDPIHSFGKTDVACIHHYYTKSEEEFAQKLIRGRADTEEKRPLSELDQIHAKYNAIRNTDAWDFYSRKLNGA